MKLSIITIVYNNADSIERTIRSVKSQDYTDLEYIVVDGGSDDGTQERVKKYRDVVTKFISEPDEGVYDGLNKGITLATGDVIGMLHSDDVYPSKSTLSDVVSKLIKTKADFLWGDIEYFRGGDDNTVVRKWISSPFRPGLFARGWMPPHVSFYALKSSFDRWGMYDKRFKIAGDYELMFRFLEINRGRGVYLPKVLVNMRTAGKSNKNIKNVIEANCEVFRAWRKHNRLPNPIGMVLKPLSKILQYNFFAAK